MSTEKTTTVTGLVNHLEENYGELCTVQLNNGHITLEDNSVDRTVLKVKRATQLGLSGVVRVGKQRFAFLNETELAHIDDMVKLSLRFNRASTEYELLEIHREVLQHDAQRFDFDIDFEIDVTAKKIYVTTELTDTVFIIDPFKDEIDVSPLFMLNRYTGLKDVSEEVEVEQKENDFTKATPVKFVNHLIFGEQTFSERIITTGGGILIFKSQPFRNRNILRINLLTHSGEGYKIKVNLHAFNIEKLNANFPNAVIQPDDKALSIFIKLLNSLNDRISTQNKDVSYDDNVLKIDLPGMVVEVKTDDFEKCIKYLLASSVYTVNGTYFKVKEIKK